MFRTSGGSEGFKFSDLHDGFSSFLKSGGMDLEDSDDSFAALGRKAKEAEMGTVVRRRQPNQTAK